MQLKRVKSPSKSAFNDLEKKHTKKQYFFKNNYISTNLTKNE